MKRYRPSFAAYTVAGALLGPILLGYATSFVLVEKPSGEGSIGAAFTAVIGIMVGALLGAFVCLSVRLAIGSDAKAEQAAEDEAPAKRSVVDAVANIGCAAIAFLIIGFLCVVLTMTRG